MLPLGVVGKTRVKWECAIIVLRLGSGRLLARQRDLEMVVLQIVQCVQRMQSLQSSEVCEEGSQGARRQAVKTWRYVSDERGKSGVNQKETRAVHLDFFGYCSLARPFLSLRELERNLYYY